MQNAELKNITPASYADSSAIKNSKGQVIRPGTLNKLKNERGFE